jgi:hypothetical protein
MLEPVRPGAVSPGRALCLPTFSHLLIVNKTSLARALSLSLSPSLPRSLSLSLFLSLSKCEHPLILAIVVPSNRCGGLREATMRAKYSHMLDA